MVGNVSSFQLAAASMANYIFIVPLLFGMGFTYAITPLVGTANGKNNLNECKLLFSNSFFVQLLNATVMTVIALAIGLLIPFFDANTVKTELAQSYYNYLAISMFPVIMMCCFKNYFDGFGFTVYGMLAMLLGNIINIFFNWILIYGNLGFPALELDGAGIATLLSRICAFVFIVALSIWLPKLKNLIELPRISKLNKEIIIEKFYKIGLNVSIQSTVEMSAFTLIILFAGWLGTTEAAAYQITISVAGIAYLSTIGISSAATVMISNYNGAKNVRGILDCSLSLSLLASIFMLICTATLIATRFIVPSIFVNDIDVIKLAPTLLFMMALFQIPDGLNVTFNGVLRGLLDTKVPMYINAISFWGIMVPAAYFLAFKLDLGIIGIMSSVIASIFLCSVAIYLRYRIVLRKQIMQYKMEQKP
jgi:MATE family multidrug resistance protein